MPASINLYSLSSIYWRPARFDVVGEKFSFKKEPVYFNNGIKFNLFNALKEPKDVKFNRRTGLFLTNVYNNSAIFVDKDTPLNIENLTEINSPISNPLNNNVIKLSASNNFSLLYESNNQGLENTDVLKFIFVGNSQIMVESTDRFYLTYESLSNFGLKLRPKITPLNSSQLFEYLLSDNEIVLFPSGSNYQQVVAKYPNNVYGVINTPYTSLNNTISSTTRLKFTSVNLKKISNDSVTQSFLTKYETSPINEPKYLTPDQELINESYYQNYLGIYPYEYPSLSNNESGYHLHIHGLKNYQTPEYNYSLAPQNIFGPNGIRRDYHKIFSGTNQSKGLNNIYLGYEADTQEIEFLNDRDTVFHFPSTSEAIPLNSQNESLTSLYSGLIEDGAIAGEIPYTSDRVYVKLKSYEEDVPGLPQPSTINRYSNTWLCSWLSGSTNGEKIWMDRFYNAAYYTLDQALSAKSMVYHDKLDPTKTYSYDVSSTLIFYPGVLYKYHRAGRETSRNFLPFLDKDPYLPLGSKVLQISSWNTNVLYDVSNYGNNGYVFFNTDENLKSYGNWLNLNGATHASIPSKSVLLQPTRLTISFWVHCEDWNNIEGNQIFGNYYNSGFGLINESALTAPLFTIVNSLDGRAYNINYRFNVVNSHTTNLIKSPSVEYGGPRFIMRLQDLSYIIFDDTFLIYYKFTPDGRKVDNYTTINLSSYISKIDQVEIDSEQKIYIFDKNIQRVVVLNSDGTFNSITTASYGTERIEIDLNDTLIYTKGNTSVIDNFNNLWYVVGSNLYKNDEIFANIGPTQHISVDSENNLWIAHAQDSITKINNKGQIEFTIRIGAQSSLPANPCLTRPSEKYRYLNFLKTPSTLDKCKNSTTSKDILVIVDSRDEEVYLVSLNGEILARLNLRSLSSPPTLFYADGDFSGYQYLRKFGKFNKRLSWLFKIAEPTGTNAQYKTLSYITSAMPSGWHHLAFVFDASKGFAKYYIDSIEVDKTFFTPAIYQLYYDFRSPLLIGATSIRSYTLNDIIGVEDGYKFIGKFSDLRMYAKSLTLGEIEQIYFSSDLIEDRKPLVWNIRVGSRNYIEEIQHWFQMQLPGSKSKYFNINIHNLDAPQEVKLLIENSIKNNIHKLAPASTSLYKINWM